jgi:hypothetical protein
MKKQTKTKTGKYCHKTKPYLTEYLNGQYAENFLLPCVHCSWIVSFRILVCNLAATTGAIGLCAAGLSLVELPVLMISNLSFIIDNYINTHTHTHTLVLTAKMQTCCNEEKPGIKGYNASSRVLCLLLQTSLVCFYAINAAVM